MEQGLKLWKLLFGRLREVDYEEFSNNFHNFVYEKGDCNLDEYQMRYIRQLIDPDKQFRVSISDFLIFFNSFWDIPSKRKLLFEYQFVVKEESQSNTSHNDFDYLSLILSNKIEQSSIKYLQTGSKIDVFRDKIVINNEQTQQLNKVDVMRMGSNALPGKNDVVFPNQEQIQPTHCKIGIGTSGYFVKDQSTRNNRMRFIVGDKKPLVLDYKMVFEIGSSGCLFYVRKIFPEPVFEPLQQNFVNFVFTGQTSLEAELLDFQNKSQKRLFHDVGEWRREQVQQKKDQQLQTQGDMKGPNSDYYIELECFEGEMKGQVFSIKGTNDSLSFGRDKNSSVLIKHLSVSLNHAIIQFNKNYGAWVIKELHKTLGTYIFLANYDQYVGKASSNFHLIQTDLPFEIFNYIFLPRLQFKKPDDL